MSTSPSLPTSQPSELDETSDKSPSSNPLRELKPESVPVYNLTVLVRSGEKFPVVARAANLEVPEVEAQTVREALSKLVSNAKNRIAATVSSSEIPWIDPPSEPNESESRFVVPLHL